MALFLWTEKQMGCHVKVISLFLLAYYLTTSNAVHEDSIRCITIRPTTCIRSSQYIHTPDSPLYSTMLQSSQQNPRWLNSTSPKPLAIITPYAESQIQATILCSRKHGFQIRVRSGGHDYEGLSFLCNTPFVLVDLINLRQEKNS
ncbi:unnamed protein product [Thlaspi arvense]|uniref:FAD-binding PCMH-type domain-containing protein n=1 Tax=Thlaspi arvense TaxID=13288 RepID=A0AAU9RFI2_THLAR|nr:unnamed protein product [Thlaspi arvense]